MTYDNWKTTNRDDEQLGPAPDDDGEPAGSRLLLEPVAPELSQKEWYEQVYLPNVRKALRGEHVDRALLEGGTQQANDDQNWDSRSEGNWS